MKRGSASTLPDAGSFIYAYCNVRTNQVLYSLERALKPRHLKQLPDVGANNTPPTLRKDSWRPLFSVALAQDGKERRQGLYIMRKLREYRKLHELNWTPSPLLSRPYTQEEIDEMQRELEQRGGSKRETVYDIIKRKKWKLRVKSVTNQKANSIADLAAILLDQNTAGREELEKNREDRESHRQRTIQQMQSLAKEAQDGGLERVENILKRLQERHKTAEPKQRLGLSQGIAKLDLKVKMMRFAIPAVAEAREAARKLVAAETEAYNEAKAQAEAKPNDAGEEQPPPRAPHPRAEDRMLAELLPFFPQEIDPVMIRAAEETTKRDLDALGLAKVPRLRFDRPAFSLDGVAIRWANMLDAEYAKAWPREVAQLPMGLARHVAPLPPESPRHPWQLAGKPDEGKKYPGIAADTHSFREGLVSGFVKRKAERREREGVLERIKDEVLARVAGKEGKRDAVNGTERGVKDGPEVRA